MSGHAGATDSNPRPTVWDTKASEIGQVQYLSVILYWVSILIVPTVLRFPVSRLSLYATLPWCSLFAGCKKSLLRFGPLLKCRGSGKGFFGSWSYTANILASGRLAMVPFGCPWGISDLKKRKIQWRTCEDLACERSVVRSWCGNLWMQCWWHRSSEQW